jgi:hypothetical protein
METKLLSFSDSLEIIDYYLAVPQCVSVTSVSWAFQKQIFVVVFLHLTSLIVRFLVKYPQIFLPRNVQKIILLHFFYSNYYKILTYQNYCRWQ